MPGLPDADLHALSGGGAPHLAPLPRRGLGIRLEMGAAPRAAPDRVPGPAGPHRPRALDRPDRRDRPRDGRGPAERRPARVAGAQGERDRRRRGLPRLLGPGARLLGPGGEGPPAADAQAPGRRCPGPGRAAARARAGSDRGARRRGQVDHAPGGELPRLAAALRSAAPQRGAGRAGGHDAPPAPGPRRVHAPPPGAPATEDGWEPEATALPYGPWLALAALEIAFLGPWLAEAFPSPLVALLTGQPWVPP